MDIDFTQTRRAISRLAQLYDDLAARADVGSPETGDTPEPGPGREAGDLVTVRRDARRLADRVARLGGALAGFSSAARAADDAHAHRLATLASRAEER